MVHQFVAHHCANCYHDYMEIVGQLIESALKARKISTRELGRLVGRDHATIGRYISGTTVLPTKLHQRVASILFKSPSQKNRFLKTCATAKQNSKSLSKKKNEIKKAKTAVIRKGYFATVFHEPRIQINSDVLIDGRMVLSRLAEADSEIKLKSVTLLVEVKKRVKSTDIHILWIMPHEGLVFFPDFLKYKYKRASIGTNAIGDYLRYCSDNKIHRYGLLEIAREAIETSDTLNMLTYRDGGSTIVDSGKFEGWLNGLELLPDFIKSGKEAKTKLAIGTIRNIALDMKIILNGAREARDTKPRLLSHIDTLFSKLS